MTTTRTRMQSDSRLSGYDALLRKLRDAEVWQLACNGCLAAMDANGLSEKIRPRIIEDIRSKKLVPKDVQRELEQEFQIADDEYLAALDRIGSADDDVMALFGLARCYASILLAFRMETKLDGIDVIYEAAAASGEPVAFLERLLSLHG